MRLGSSGIYTLREQPADAVSASHSLSLRSGLIQQASAGHYHFGPLAVRSMRKIENIIREELESEGATEIKMPIMPCPGLLRAAWRVVKAE